MFYIDEAQCRAKEKLLVQGDRMKHSLSPWGIIPPQPASYSPQGQDRIRDMRFHKAKRSFLTLRAA